MKKQEKPIFKLSDYDNTRQVCMHITDLDSYNIFAQVLDREGLTWIHGRKYSEHIPSYFKADEDSPMRNGGFYLDFYKGQWGGEKYFYDHNYFVLEFEDFNWGDIYFDETEEMNLFLENIGRT